MPTQANRPLRPADAEAPAPSLARRMALPLLLSLLIPGLGQLYNGQKAKGVAILVAVVAVVAVQLWAMSTGDLAFVAMAGSACTLALSGIGVIAAADAGWRASKG